MPRIFRMFKCTLHFHIVLVIYLHCEPLMNESRFTQVQIWCKIKARCKNLTTKTLNNCLFMRQDKHKYMQHKNTIGYRDNLVRIDC